MRVWWIALALFACKGKDHPGTGSATGSGHPLVADAAIAAPPIDWKTCDAALRKAATEPLDVRPSLVIEGCEVCGDWTPLLHWNTPQTEKGPTRKQIETAMSVCGYCNANAKQRFLGTLDSARGMNVRTPWRYLGEMCKGEVSALPDNRFTTAPLYALDRIARAATAHGGESANLMASIELPLPAVTVTGAGIVMPDVEEGVSPTAGPLAITVMGDGLHVAKLPRARLGASGVAIDLGNYPGDVVKPADLPTALAKLANGDSSMTITILAPVATPAQALVPIVAAAAKVAPIYLAVNAHGAPEGWDLPATIPVALVAEGGDKLALTGEMSVQQLATELAKRAKSGARKVLLKAP
ncbi:MAG TPA: hypothetical protein VFQ65_34700 [Kofleriaceae bacterium]|nr:hypothetical protein [Kofleriaceae bacterium]